MRRRIAVALLAAWPASAQEVSDLAPDSAPLPEARPAAASEPAEDVSPESQGEPEQAPSLIPPGDGSTEAAPSGEDSEEPSVATPLEGASQAEPTDEATGEAPSATPMREALAETPEGLAACLAELDALGVLHEPAEPVAEASYPNCGMVNPVTVSTLAPGVALEPPATMRCATARAAAQWVADVVLPLSGKLGRGDLAAIEQGTAYLCRPRADGEMSEHAWGNALDVLGFRFSDGEPIPVEPRAGDGTLDEAFQRAVRAGACLDFATVLGPGSDADHADHLHLDIKDRDGGFRICQ